MDWKMSTTPSDFSFSNWVWMQMKVPVRPTPSLSKCQKWGGSKTACTWEKYDCSHMQLGYLVFCCIVCNICSHTKVKLLWLVASYWTASAVKTSGLVLMPAFVAFDTQTSTPYHEYWTSHWHFTYYIPVACNIQVVNSVKFSVITTALVLAYLHSTVMALFPVLICTFVTLSINTSREEEVGSWPQSGQHRNWKWVTVKGALACA